MLLAPPSSLLSAVFPIFPCGDAWIPPWNGHVPSVSDSIVSYHTSDGTRDNPAKLAP